MHRTRTTRAAARWAAGFEGLLVFGVTGDREEGRGGHGDLNSCTLTSSSADEGLGNANRIRKQEKQAPDKLQTQMIRP